jgi:hypothetical protein
LNREDAKDAKGTAKAPNAPKFISASAYTLGFVHGDALMNFGAFWRFGGLLRALRVFAVQRPAGGP